MKVFFSWSGKRSKAAAEAFYHWLPDVLQSVEPWMSSEDICSGAGWNEKIRYALHESNYGIIFITRDNMKSEWLMFEAGAIAKHVTDSRVVPLIVDDELKPAMLTGPLGQLHAREATEDKIKRLITDLNFECKVSVRDDRVERLFDTLWPTLFEKLGDLPLPEGDKPELDSQEMLTQILAGVRDGRSKPMTFSEHLISKAWQSDSKGLRRLRLRLQDVEWPLAEKDRVIELWETLEEGERFTSISIMGHSVTVHMNGDLSIDDWEEA